MSEKWDKIVWGFCFFFKFLSKLKIFSFSKSSLLTYASFKSSKLVTKSSFFRKALICFGSHKNTYFKQHRTYPEFDECSHEWWTCQLLPPRFHPILADTNPLWSHLCFCRNLLWFWYINWREQHCRQKCKMIVKLETYASRRMVFVVVFGGIGEGLHARILITIFSINDSHHSDGQNSPSKFIRNWYKEVIDKSHELNIESCMTVTRHLLEIHNSSYALWCQK